MSEASLALIFLAAMSLSLLVTTVAVLILARDVRVMLRALRSALPEAKQAIREARQSLRHVRRMLTAADRATERVEAVIHTACGVASDSLDRLTRAQHTVESFWMKRFGNGAGAEPRRHHRGG